MSDCVVEDIVDYLASLDIVQRRIDVFTEADLNQYKDRPSSAIITQRQSPSEPSSTADIDFHGITVAVVTGKGEKGYRAGSAMSDNIYRALRLVLDVTINGTFYPCIKAVTSPQIVSVDEEERTQYNFDVNVTRYIGE